MQQISLFSESEVEKASAKCSKPSKPSNSQIPLRTSIPTTSVVAIPKPKTPNKPVPYGVCHRCSRPISIPGLDTCYCTAFGWVSRPQNQWTGGASRNQNQPGAKQHRLPNRPHPKSPGALRLRRPWRLTRLWRQPIRSMGWRRSLLQNAQASHRF